MKSSAKHRKQDMRARQLTTGDRTTGQRAEVGKAEMLKAETLKAEDGGQRTPNIEHPISNIQYPTSNRRPRIDYRQRVEHQYALCRGLGYWELIFEGRQAIFKHEQGALYVACLLLDPPSEPMHAVALALKASEMGGLGLRAAEVIQQRSMGLEDAAAGRDDTQAGGHGRADAGARGEPKPGLEAGPGDRQGANLHRSGRVAGGAVPGVGGRASPRAQTSRDHSGNQGWRN
jgi:hypothetical protein